MATAVALAPPPILQFFNNSGQINSNGQVLTQVGGLNYPTYQDSGGTVSLPNPIPLNSRGEVSNASGTSVQLFLQTGITYTFTLYDANGNQLNQATYVTPTLSAALSTYTATGSGATTRTVQGKVSDILSILDYGGDSTGVADNVTACANAENALPSTGGWILMPPGSYSLSTHTVSKSVTWVGQGEQTTTIFSRDATSNVFDVTGIGVKFQDLSFAASVTRTNGAYILFDTASSIGTVRDCNFNGWWYGIRINGTSNYDLDNVTLSSGVAASGEGIRVDAGLAINLNKVVVTNSSGARPLAGLAVTTCGDISITDSHFIQCVVGCLLQPGAAATISSINAVNTYFDNCGQRGMLAQPNTGAILRCRFVECWFSSAVSADGATLDTATFGGTINGIDFIDCEMYANGGNGLTVSGSGCSNIFVLAGKYAQNTASGISIGASASDISIKGARVGPVGAFTANNIGISLGSGTINNLLIDGNDLTANTSAAISNSSTGTDQRIVNNVGWNDRSGTTSGIGGLPVAPATFTYTAGPQPEQIYVNSGTVSLITVDGVNVFSQTNQTIFLSPNKQVAVTYSVIPGMAKTVM